MAMKRSSRTNANAGFTLAELLVSVAIFSVVVTVAIGALLTVLNANRKAQALQTVMNNLNFALEQMSRDIRVGTDYRCGPGTAPLADCTGQALGYTSHDGVTRVLYELDGAGQITRSIDGGQAQPVTASDITIEGINFIVSGPANDAYQPKVLFALRGYTGKDDPGHPELKTYFNLQTTVSARLLDR